MGSYVVMAKILKDDRAVTPDADLSALLSALQHEERSGGSARRPQAHSNMQQGRQNHTVTVQVQRNAGGSAGFAFEKESLKITSRPSNPANLHGMEVGDCIVAVNGRGVTTCAEYNSLARGVTRFELTLQRPGAQLPPAPRAPSQARAAGGHPPARAQSVPRQ